MKTSRHEKNPLLPPELWFLLFIGAIAVLAGLALGPVTILIHYLQK